MEDEGVEDLDGFRSGAVDGGVYKWLGGRQLIKQKFSLFLMHAAYIKHIYNSFLKNEFLQDA